MVMIAALLPEAGAITLHKLQAIEPFRALIEVQFRHNQANGAAMIGFQILPIMFERDKECAMTNFTSGKGFARCKISRICTPSQLLS